MTEIKPKGKYWTKTEIIEYIKRVDGALERVLEVLAEKNLIGKYPYLNEAHSWCVKHHSKLTKKHPQYVFSAIVKHDEILNLILSEANKRIDAVG